MSVKFREKPVEPAIVDAFQWDSTADTANEWFGDRYGVDWAYASPGSSSVCFCMMGGMGESHYPTLYAAVGDWVVKSAFGQFHVMSAAEFKAAYEPVG